MGEQITLGDLIKLLSENDRDRIVRFDFGGFPDYFNSYRGFYEQLALGYDDQSAITVKELLERCNLANGGTFTGWKGGEYQMGSDTPIWAANSGDCTRVMLTGVSKTLGEFVILKTAHSEPSEPFE